MTGPTASSPRPAPSMALAYAFGAFAALGGAVLAAERVLLDAGASATAPTASVAAGDAADSVFLASIGFAAVFAVLAAAQPRLRDAPPGGWGGWIQLGLLALGATLSRAAAHAVGLVGQPTRFIELTPAVETWMSVGRFGAGVVALAFVLGAALIARAAFVR